MRKLFKITATLEDEYGVDYNSVVDVPAHLKGFMAFGKEVKDYFIQNEEKRIVSGVMISADTEIYRNDKQNGEHYVYFPAETIDILRKKFFRNGYTNNLNEMHDMRKKVTPEGAFLIDSYIIDSKNPYFPNVPEAFEQMKLNDGSWIGNYYIESDELWAKIKDGTYNGFSVEGYFTKEEVKSKIKMKKENKFLKFLGLESEEKTKFAQATTADGVVLMYDGELAEGVILLQEDETPAPAGEHQLTLEDGSMVVVELDETGAVVSIQAVGEDMEAETTAEIAEAMKAVAKETAASVLAKMDEKFAEFEARFKAIEKGEKFEHKGKKTSIEGKSNWKSTIK